MGATKRGACFARTFRGSIETHSLVQDFFFDHDFRLRRHDYSVNIAGGFAASQLTSDYIVADGIHLPTRRAPTRVGWMPADLGHADGIHRHQRGQFHLTD